MILSSRLRVDGDNYGAKTKPVHRGVLTHNGTSRGNRRYMEWTRTSMIPVFNSVTRASAERRGGLDISHTYSRTKRGNTDSYNGQGHPVEKKVYLERLKCHKRHEKIQFVAFEANKNNFFNPKLSPRHLYVFCRCRVFQRKLCFPPGLFLPQTLTFGIGH